MKVSASQPFQIIYSLYQHEYLGYLFESFVIHLDETGKLTFQHQNISSKNAYEFAKGLDDTDYELIKSMDTIQQDAIIRKFTGKNLKPIEFFQKVYQTENGNELLKNEIDRYLENSRSNILKNLYGKRVFEMGNDGEPAWRELEVQKEKASVLFHFRRNDENTHYFPTMKFKGEKLDFQYKGAYIICKQPAWMVLENNLITFEKEVDGQKLKPFLNKKFIVVPKKVEETYYKKFIAPLVASFDVYAKGFDIKSEDFTPVPVLKFYELPKVSQQSLFGHEDESNSEDKIVFELMFEYGSYQFKADKPGLVNVNVERQGDNYVFHKISRKKETENNYLKTFGEYGLSFKHSKATLPKTEAFGWLNYASLMLEELGVKVLQSGELDKKYFLGKSKITIEVQENIDWFDVRAVIMFGEYEIPFIQLRKYILKKQHEFKLPNGEIAVIPEAWLKEYSELFAFAEESEKDGDAILQKHHLALVKELETGNLAKVEMSQKLEKLRSFMGIDEADIPPGFHGTLRPYQKAGYDWLMFLRENHFGGCLADDMGLGKTVQTLTLLQNVQSAEKGTASLLIMPTSLVYNWEMEAKKFTPELNILNYTGTNRDKDPSKFAAYDLVITSYGIVRLDIDLLQQYYFNYVILDESQAIKNPGSNIAKVVRTLNGKNRLILTGTPLENSTMDLWSQMDFINPGLLGSISYFKNEFLNPIEKKNDQHKTKRLNLLIKPFILRRHKSQVATELPDKVEQLYYSTMTPEQEEVYEEVKSFYRNKILDSFQQKTNGKHQLMMLQGLTKLRLIANHPVLAIPEFKGDSGKMQDVEEMIKSAMQENHKVLIFSQFVKHLQLFSNQLQKSGISFAYLDGSTKDRQGQVNRFQSDSNIKLFLISLKAGGLGLNLTKADYVFILDPWWNPAAEAQAIDRTHRIGQVNKVFAYKFVTKGTVEEKILALQNKKIRLSKDLITTEESFVKSLSKEDIELILT